MKHGEFKTPGGKLIAVDFDVINDVLTSVQVSGDFFLYPDDALADLTDALEGAPVGMATEDLASRIGARLRPDADLVGSSPLALATAVQRAIAEPTAEVAGA